MTSFASIRFARELIASLAQLGVSDFVVCPGSRSGPLAHALAEASTAPTPFDVPAVRAHVRIDERSAGFVALGLAKAGALRGAARPVAVVTTSGTAVGNLMPAVMEAHHGGIPLVVITADRPGELRGVGANQTTDQVGIFGTFVRWSADVAAPTQEEAPGRARRIALQAVELALGKAYHGDNRCAPAPVHLDLEFRAPLHNDGGMWPPLPDLTPPVITAPPLSPTEAEPLPPEDHTVVIAGDGAGEVAGAVAAAHGWPLIPEATSGAHHGPTAIPRHIDLLVSDAGQALVRHVHQVVVIGRTTLTRPVSRLVDGAATLMVAAHGARWREAPRHATRILPTVPDSWWQVGAPAEPSRWLSQWRDAAAALPALPTRWSPTTVAATVLGKLGEDDVVFTGASGPIRALNHVAPAGPGPRIVANRGLSGIDGTLSTASGLSLGLGATVTALVGDLTFLHDLGALLVGVHEQRPSVRVVVMNDGGGTIFSAMEHAQAPQAHVERFFTTPVEVDIAGVCAGTGATHAVVRSASELAAQFRRPVDGIHVIEAYLKSTLP